MRSGLELWAKKKEKDGIFYWLSLKQHLEDTREVMGLLWEHWLSEGQRIYIANSMKIEEDAAKSLTMLIGAIHDIGKATPAFQIQRGFQNSEDLDLLLLEKLEYEGFSGIKDLELTDRGKTPHAYAGEVICRLAGINRGIASIIGAHHGVPMKENYSLTSFVEAYTANFYQEEKEDSPICKKWKATQEELLSWALESCGYKNVEELPRCPKPTQLLLSGLLIMADWIASNEDYFPLFTLQNEDSQELCGAIAKQEDKAKQEIQKHDRVESAWLKWTQNQTWEAKQLFDANQSYQSSFHFMPRDFQEKVFTEIAVAEDIGLVILEAPMGCGKTEAALMTAEQLAGKQQCAGVFFGLPTQASSNGIFPRVESWVDSLGQENQEKLSLRLSHGKAALNEEFQSLSRNCSEGINPDGEKTKYVYVNEWFSGRKKAMLDDFIVGTVDHLLLMALKQKHLMLRHLGFSKKVVIIDEVHAYDAYMGQYLYMVLQWLGAYKVPTIILSATLPIERRKDLMKYYLKGRGIKEKDIGNFDFLKTESYPLLTFSKGSEVESFSDFQEEKEKKVTLYQLDEENLVDTVKSLSKNGAVIGIIVNTVGRAQRITKDLLEAFPEEVHLLHSRFIDTDRIKKEKELLKKIGKNAERPKRFIVVGTQVIEQSLDIDFDLMISDLCPVDLLIQRIGRLHRHKIERPKEHSESRLYLMGISESFDFEKGSRRVYGDYLLMKTQCALGESISIPRDISPLVQDVYGEWNPSLAPDLRKKYEESKKKQNETLDKQKRKAEGFRLDKPKLECSDDISLDGLLDNDLPIDSEEIFQAKVRDIGSSIEVIAVKKYGAGYGLFQEKKDISEELSKASMARKLACQTLRLGESIIHMEREKEDDKEEGLIRYLEDYNRRELPEWQNEAWLKGSLGLIFDENNDFPLKNIVLHYDEKFGLQWHKKEV
ncbi:CRISPR-associated helicase Cas3' [Oribacterium asaccharolyticum]|uniref:CRISPR-associated helicase Cas3' n=1 Tax=Oribacterium asaccharolyticum TaxID=1501332 RepID=UPI0028E549C6|nr:CRISPR-associated helicase Cas3' [Oribacterium asaccharolyticum]